MKKTIENKIKKKLGFTLVEIVVAIAIMGILTAVLAPTLLSYVEDSRKSSDTKLGDEIVEVSKLAVGKTDVFDEVFHYAISNNFLTYSDSSGVYGQQVIDGEFWAPDGMGNATTITFNPVSQNGKMVYVIADGLVNDMVYGNGSVIQPARVMDACDAYAAQCRVNEMTTDDENISAALYGELVRNFGNTIELKSETYRNSSFTIFVTFTYQEDTVTPRVYGYFNGTNLRDSATSAVGTGTTEVIETPTGSQGNGTNSGTTVSNIDYSGLTGGGAVSYRPFETEEAATLSKDKFFAFCNALSNKDTITSIQFVSDGNRTNATDVSNEQNGKIVAWQEGNKICISASENGKKIKLSTDSSHLFDTAFTGLNNVEEIIMYNVNIDSVTNISAMFKGNAKMTYLDINSLTFNRVTDMSYLFSGCTSLKQLKYTTWNTSNVTNMSCMFENCQALAALPMKNWNTAKVTNMSGLFKGCNRISAIDVSVLNTSKCENFSHMFDGCTNIKTLDLSKFIVDSGKSFAGMFKDCLKLESVDMTDWEIGANVNNLGEMFSGCKVLKEIDGTIFINTSNVIDFNHMFYQCAVVKTLDLNNFDTTKANDMDEMFEGMVHLEIITLGGKFTFSGSGSTRCYLPEPSELYIEGANGVWINNTGRSFYPREVPSKVAATYSAIDTDTSAVLAPAATWWRGTTAPSKIKRIVVTNSYNGTSYTEVFNADVENDGGILVYVEDTIAYIVNNKNKRSSGAFLLSEDASDMFSEFTSLQAIDGLKLMNTINVTNMNNMFAKADGSSGCSQLTNIKGIENWNMQNVKTAEYMFAGTGIKSFNLSTWSIPNMKSIKGMFANSAATTINLTGWDISSVTDMSNLFKDSTSLSEITINNWVPVNNVDATDMFSGCSNLVTILTTDSMDLTKAITCNMFTGCVKLQGGNGTTFSSTGNSMAKIDNETPGYFTSNDTIGILSAVLYNAGSATGTGVELTTVGSIATPWNYQAGARTLEIKLSSLPRNQTKTLTVTVPMGMTIIKDSWTKINDDLIDVKFTPFDLDSSTAKLDQGCGNYSNSQTGTLSYTIAPYTKSTTITLKVMFDTTLWDKNIDNLTSKSGYTVTKQASGLTNSDAIVVSLNDSVVKKISKVTAANAIGGGSAGWGYSYSIWQQGLSQYISTNGKGTGATCNGNYLDSIDRSAQTHYYKSVDYTTYLYSTNSEGKTIYASFDNISPSTFNTTPQAISNRGTDPTQKRSLDVHWDNPYYNQLTDFPNLSFILSAEDGFTEGKSATMICEVKLVTFTGREITLNRSINFTIRSNAPDYSLLSLSGSNKSVLNENYYNTVNAIGNLGSFCLESRCVSALENVSVVAEFDVQTTSSKPKLKVTNFNAPCTGGQTANYKITLIDENGNTKIIDNVSLTSRGTSQGTFISAKQIAQSNGLNGNYYLKKVEYTIPSIPGNIMRVYLYQTGGSYNAQMGGAFLGTANAPAQTKLTVSSPNDSIVKTYTVTTKVGSPSEMASNNTSFSGRINSIQAPSIVAAGDEFEMTVEIAALEYCGQYSTDVPSTNLFSKPVLYMILPVGVDIDGVLIGDSSTITTSQITPNVTRVKSLEIDGSLFYVYKIAFNEEVWFGYFTENTNNVKTIGKASKWIRVHLATDSSIESTTMNLRQNVLFSDANGFMFNQSNFSGAYLINDKYDVDNDGKTSENFASIADNSKYMTIG